MKKISIEYVEDFDKLRYLKPGEYYVTLENDIDFNNPDCYINKWFTIENKPNFKPIRFINTNIIFDGNGCSLLNLTCFQPFSNSGMFETDRSTVVVKDLTIENALIAGKYYAGIIGGIFDGAINNCVIDGKVSSMYPGGLVGCSPEELTINSCDTHTIIEAIDNDERYGSIVYDANKLNIIKSSIEPYSIENCAHFCNELNIRGKKRHTKVLSKHSYF